MTRTCGCLPGVLLLIGTIAPGVLHADTVQLTVRNGRISLAATNATPAEIFEAWSRAGGVAVVNADRMPTTRLTIRLDDVPETQALDTLLRPVTGYLAQRRTTVPAPQESVFARIVIVAVPAESRTPAATPSVNTAPVASGRPPVVGLRPAQPLGAPPAGAAAPAGPTPAPGAPSAVEASGIYVDNGVTRLTGADGQPVDDDQVGAPPPPATPYGGADAPSSLPGGARVSPQVPRPGAPAGVPQGVSTPGMPTAPPPPRER